MRAIMLLSRLSIVTVVQNEGQNGHTGTTTAGDSQRGNIAVSPVETVRGDSGGDLDVREPQTQRDDGHGRKAGNGSRPGVDACEEAGRKGQVRRG